MESSTSCRTQNAIFQDLVRFLLSDLESTAKVLLWSDCFLFDGDHGGSPVIATNLHMKKLPDAVETKNMCALIDCQAPEETQLQVKLLKAELQDQVPGTCGMGEESVTQFHCADGATPKWAFLLQAVPNQEHEQSRPTFKEAWVMV